MVDVIGGKPGIRSSRFARAGATDSENNRKLLRLMKEVPSAKRSAVFVSYVAISKNGKFLGGSEGKCPGAIGFDPRGENGFGYDPLFTPAGYNRTFAQLPASVKNSISHRAIALKRARAIIQKHL